MSSRGCSPPRQEGVDNHATESLGMRGGPCGGFRLGHGAGCDSCYGANRDHDAGGIYLGH